MDFLDSIWTVTDIYEAYGLKGCILSSLVFVLILGGIIAIAFYFF